MRIIGGQYKGRILNPPKGLPVRPTTDFAKEGLFNMLQHRYNLDGIDVCDLFCGTGNISFEFLSRGAKSVYAVDTYLANLRFIQEQSKTFNANNLHVVKQDVIRFLKENSVCFDLIFADPPYDWERLAELPELIFNSQSLKEGGILIIEHGKDTNFTKAAWFLEHRCYGNVNFSIFIKNKP